MGKSVRIAGKNKPLQPVSAGGEATTPNVDGLMSVGKFPIVGIGASAGGLEAIEQFLTHVPENSGMAFVVVQHLDPTHKGILPELLQRVTPMKVRQVRQRMTVKPDCVYVIPANKDMAIQGGELRLQTPTAPRGLRLPIDGFFRSLAEDHKDRSVGVILSGMGSDGSLGLRAIKEAAGVICVQEPASAKCDGMPRSAIDTGLADIVAAAAELPAKILACLLHTPRSGIALLPDNNDPDAFAKIVSLLRTHTGHDFSLYKKSTVFRRIERRMGIHQIGKLHQYGRYLQENPQELELLFKELLIGVTNFFRDAATWDHLRDHTLPALLKNRHAKQELRAWIAGCSSGEEAYSLAIVFREALAALNPARRCRLQIFATDLDMEAIDKARQGVYPENIAADVSPDRLARFFIREEGKLRVAKEIRETVVFAQQDLVMDPPFTKLDILVCRNLLIYLESDLQKKILPLFHYSLLPDGILFLGSSETIGSFTNLFRAEADRLRIYRRIESGCKKESVEFPPSLVPAHVETAKPPVFPLPAMNLQTLADQAILRHHAPPAVLTTAKGDIIYISGRTGKYLEPAAGKANLNFFAMVRDGLRGELNVAFHKVTRETGEVQLKGLKVGTDEGGETVDVTIQSLREPVALEGMVLIVFKDMPAPSKMKGAPTATPAAARSARFLEQERELQLVREELHTTREEMQTSQEELRSANEELQSTNEELQSTNEELTTSREEMQSMNEELQTINAELQTKVEDLSLAASDMKNLLDSTDIATVFLDSALKVRRFTPRATKIIKFIPGDVGRPITDLASDLNYPELAEDAREVLRTLVFSEKRVSTHDGRWFGIRIMPYRTIDDRINGVVITLSDITAHRAEMDDVRRQGQRGSP